MRVKVNTSVRLRFGEPILILALQGIGNTLFLIPMIEELKRICPGHPVDIVVRSEACRRILENGRFVREHYVLPPFRAGSFFRIIRLLWMIRRRRYGVSFLTFPANHVVFNVMSVLAGARWRVSFRYDYAFFRNLSPLNNRFVPVERVHDYVQNLGMLRVLAKDVRMTLNPHLWLRPVPPAGRRGLVMGFHPGSSRDRAMVEKRWPAERFRELIRRLAERLPGSCFFVFFGPDEDDLKRDFQSMEDDRIRVVSGVPLEETLRLIEGADLFIANDSGLMNLAVAMGRRVLNIAGGPTDPVRTWPMGSGSAILFSDIHCYPCRGLQNIGEAFSCPYPSRLCLEDIPVDRVEVLVMGIIAPPGRVKKVRKNLTFSRKGL